MKKSFVAGAAFEGESRFFGESTKKCSIGLYYPLYISREEKTT